MNTAGKIALGALAGIGIAIGGAAIAHSRGAGHGPGTTGHGPGMMGHGPGMVGHGGMTGDHAARAGEHLTALKTELKLTAKQEPAWQAFEKAVRTQAEGMAKGHPTAGPDGMEARVAFMEQRLAGMKTVLKARKDLYATLTPEQKAVLDRHGPGKRHG